MITKVFIPNRGEIAVRIIHAAKSMGVKTVVALWPSDNASVAAQLTDEVYWWPLASLELSYLNVENIISAAINTQANAIHPGYGFLSENYALAQACAENNLIFIGPLPNHLKQMGNKIAARQLAIDSGVPVLKGWFDDELDSVADKSLLPYPLLVKAAMGGGGKAMHLVHSANELGSVVKQAQGEALRYFGDSKIFIEQYIGSCRHIEVQILSDSHGNTIHLGERECSVQRRHQKIVEEAPAPNLPEAYRLCICNDAIKLADSIGYLSAGTIEFLVDDNFHHYFLEMNTRIQVEHPVTEMITGVDLVLEQFKIANGLPLSFLQSDIRFNGHAIEARVYAEKPAKNFEPSPGYLCKISWPSSSLARVETAIHKPCNVLPDFDPLLAKVITYGSTRQMAIEKLNCALQDTVVMGIDTNIAYLIQILNNSNFIDSKINTQFCQIHQNILLEPLNALPSIECFTAYALWKIGRIATYQGVRIEDAFYRNLYRFGVVYDNQKFDIDVRRVEGGWNVIVLGREMVVSDFELLPDAVKFVSATNNYQFYIDTTSLHPLFYYQGKHFEWQDSTLLPEYVPSNKNNTLKDNRVVATIPSRIVKINVEPGQKVQKGDVLVVLEAMKMETQLRAWSDCQIESVNVKMGEAVAANHLLMELSNLTV